MAAVLSSSRDVAQLNPALVLTGLIGRRAVVIIGRTVAVVSVASRTSDSVLFKSILESVAVKGDKNDGDDRHASVIPRKC